MVNHCLVSLIKMSVSPLHPLEGPVKFATTDMRNNESTINNVVSELNQLERFEMYPVTKKRRLSSFSFEASIEEVRSVIKIHIQTHLLQNEKSAGLQPLPSGNDNTRNTVSCR